MLGNPIDLTTSRRQPMAQGRTEEAAAPGAPPIRCRMRSRSACPLIRPSTRFARPPAASRLTPPPSPPKPAHPCRRCGVDRFCSTARARSRPSSAWPWQARHPEAPSFPPGLLGPGLGGARLGVFFLTAARAVVQLLKGGLTRRPEPCRRRFLLKRPDCNLVAGGRGKRAAFAVVRAARGLSGAAFLAAVA